MITDIPTHNDFRGQGVAFLNLAWGAIARRVITWGEIEENRVEHGLEITKKEYWTAVHRELLVATALSQQAAELLLKEKIASVSPFLLIAGSTQQWPSGQEISFSEFRTIDAQDLPRVHDTVCKVPLAPGFHSTFGRLRILRNKIFHTIAKDLKVTAVESLVTMLEISHHLIGPNQWWSIRKAWEDEGPQIGSGDYDRGTLTLEGLAIIDILPPKIVKDLLGFDKKQRRYNCVECSTSVSDFHDRLKSAILVPNEPGATSVKCIVCNETRIVTRSPCLADKCQGNVIDASEGCLTCGVC